MRRWRRACACGTDWPTPARQVRVEGPVERLPRGASEQYFQSRPRGSQSGAHASRQSQHLGSREELLARVEEMRERFRGREVPCPDFWGGYRLVPDRIELWEGKTDRLHERRVWTRPSPTEPWTVELLQP